MKHLIIIPFILLNIFANAQDLEKKPPIPLELMVGNEAYRFQFSINRPLFEGSRFGFFSQLAYKVNHEKTAPNSINTEAMITYKLTNHFNIGAGTRLNTASGFRTLLATSYGLFNKKISLFIQPSIEIHKDGFFELFSFFEWHPNNGKKIQPFFRVQALTDFNKQHVYSYHNWRVGAKHKNFSIGPAINFEYIGPQGIVNTNYGGFIMLWL
ncbi:hypothetical protein CXF68_14325 [Tenacibaculum sp. Bg11-29]|uniref:hypothetical protein n=1 Tax=Tenacibaculum sp. Bg11-29 TaxID=2058306 RepID=UPI000C325E51|nr:hypothetical protein [Tenacibaculum sp. Bg11-29]PKH51788.1 hypothetical protein CXF68_14325 [Tenacibaculum sp. Bg11-29]